MATKRKKVPAEIQRHRVIKCKYGLTLTEYIEKLADQNFECAICGTLLATEGINTHLDHCHETGKIREFLCGYCNRALGHFKDDIKRVESAVLYLERHQCTPS